MSKIFPAIASKIPIELCGEVILRSMKNAGLQINSPGMKTKKLPPVYRGKLDWV